MTTITIATANTYHGRAIQAPNGLAPLSKVDILLLQEVFEFDRKILRKQLDKVGFRILCDAPEFGLTIAIRHKSLLKYIPRSTQKHTLAKINYLERQLTLHSHKPHPVAFAKRGLLSADLQLPDGTTITVANVHPTTPIALRPQARYWQIRKLQTLLTTHYASARLILGGDMNHYPGPRKVDFALHSATALTPVPLGSDPTWYVRGSEQEKIMNVAARLSRRPLDDFNGQHDIILYRADVFTLEATTVVDIYSDHRAIIARFAI